MYPWHKTEEFHTSMNYFADEEEIEYNRSLGTVKGLTVYVHLSYVDNPDDLFHAGELYMGFNGKVEWTIDGKEVGAPKYWRRSK